MHSLQAVLDLPHEAMYLALGDYLAQRLDAVGSAELHPIERTLWLVREFHWAVRDGGLLGYMLLPNRPHSNDAELALRAVGAAQTASLLREAIAAYENHTPAFDDRLGLLDEVEDLPLLVWQYARAHREGLLMGGLAE
jgi:hypothetical protein